MKKQSKEPNFVSSTDYAKMCGVTLGAIHNRINKGIIVAHYIKNRLVVDISEYPRITKMKAGAKKTKVD